MESFGKALAALVAAAITLAVTSLILTAFFPLHDLGALLGLIFWLGLPIFVLCKTPKALEPLLAKRRASAASARDAKERLRSAVEIQKKPFSYQPEDVPQFFAEFIAKAKPPEKNKFETKGEYAARLPPPVNSTQSFYFLLAEKEFLYSLETAIATVVSASFFQRDYLGLRLPSHDERRGSPTTWTNTFGAEFSVSVVEKREYEILIYNHKAIPKALRYQGCLGCSVRLDRAYARENEHNLRLVAGVRFIEWKRHKHKSSHERPEFPIGLETYWDKYELDGNLASIHLINANANQQLCCWQIR